MSVTHAAEAPRVSVIVPAHNAAATLAETLASLTAQTLPAIEVLVVDDASTDGTRDVAARQAAADPRFRLLAFPANRGVAEARNAGLEAARGRWVLFLDSDDWIEPGHLASLLAAAEADPGALGAFSGYRYAREDGRPGEAIRPRLEGDLFAIMAQRCPLKIRRLPRPARGGAGGRRLRPGAGGRRGLGPVAEARPGGRAVRACRGCGRDLPPAAGLGLAPLLAAPRRPPRGAAPGPRAGPARAGTLARERGGTAGRRAAAQPRLPAAGRARRPARTRVGRARGGRGLRAGRPLSGRAGPDRGAAGLGLPARGRLPARGFLPALWSAREPQITAALDALAARIGEPALGPALVLALARRFVHRLEAKALPLTSGRSTPCG